MNIIQKAYKSLTTRSKIPSSADNIFGTLGVGKSSLKHIDSKADFVPYGKDGETLDLTGSGDSMNPNWVGLDTPKMQYWAYNFCSPLATVIDRLAEAGTNGRVEIINEDGATVKKKTWVRNPRVSRVMKLMKKPNPWQTWEEFNAQQDILSGIFGCCPVFAIRPVGMDKSFTKAFINLNLYFAKPTLNEDFDLYDESKGGIIKSWKITIANKTYNIDAKDVFIIKNGYLDSVIPNNGLPLSKVAGLDFNVSNICAAMEADNVILKKKGPLGVFSFDPGKDMAGTTPLDPKAKESLQKDLQRYGLTVGHIQYIISNMPVKWNAVSFNLRDLMTKETIRTGTDGICDRFSYPAELMSGKNATYENRNSAEKYLMQNNVIPYSLRKMAVYNDWLEMDGGYLLTLDYDHLPVLQEDILHAGQARKALSESLDIDWKAGRLTWNECRIEMGMDTVAGMDIYYDEWLPKYGKNTLKLNKKNEKSAPKDTTTKE